MTNKVLSDHRKHMSPGALLELYCIIREANVRKGKPCFAIKKRIKQLTLNVKKRK